MSFYLEIIAIQRPFPYMVDENQRTCYSCNFSARARGPIAKLEEEIGKLIYDAGYGVFGTDMWVGPKSVAPTGPGPYVQIFDTGGMPSDITHQGDKYENLSFQIIVRALNTQAGRTRALAIWNALDGRRNFTVTAA